MVFETKKSTQKEWEKAIMVLTFGWGLLLGRGVELLDTSSHLLNVLGWGLIVVRGKVSCVNGAEIPCILLQGISAGGRCWGRVLLLIGGCHWGQLWGLTDEAYTIEVISPKCLLWDSVQCNARKGQALVYFGCLWSDKKLRTATLTALEQAQISFSPVPCLPREWPEPLGTWCHSWRRTGPQRVDFSQSSSGPKMNATAKEITTKAHHPEDSTTIYLDFMKTLPYLIWVLRDFCISFFSCEVFG